MMQNVPPLSLDSGLHSVCRMRNHPLNISINENSEKKSSTKDLNVLVSWSEGQMVKYTNMRTSFITCVVWCFFQTQIVWNKKCETKMCETKSVKQKVWNKKCETKIAPKIF